jgi:hypothetical protein
MIWLKDSIESRGDVRASARISTARLVVGHSRNSRRRRRSLRTQFLTAKGGRAVHDQEGIGTCVLIPGSRPQHADS